MMDLNNHLSGNNSSRDIAKLGIGFEAKCLLVLLDIDPQQLDSAS